MVEFFVLLGTVPDDNFNPNNMNTSAVVVLTVLLIIMNIPLLLVMWKGTFQTLNASENQYKFTLRLPIPSWIRPEWFLVGYGFFTALTIMLIKMVLPEYLKVVMLILVSYVFLWVFLCVCAAILMVLLVFANVFFLLEELDKADRAMKRKRERFQAP